MFCTSKEQETCEVEKRGCEGCYYENDKNEFKNLKEIIELCRLEIAEGDKNINATLDYEDLKELFYLLESYKQAKEKINDLQDRIIDAVNYINDNCIDTNVDGTKREITNIEDLEELKNILEGKYLYE